mgnify:CR=1 FL=1
MGPLDYVLTFVLWLKVTVKKKDQVPLVADLFDPLGKATSFTKLDLRSGYYQVRIAAGDEPKTNILPDMVRLSIALGRLTNAPATFRQFLLPSGRGTHEYRKSLPDCVIKTIVLLIEEMLTVLACIFCGWRGGKA